MLATSDLPYGRILKKKTLQTRHGRGPLAVTNVVYVDIVHILKLSCQSLASLLRTVIAPLNLD